MNPWQLGSYTVTTRIAAGGMGQVWRATHAARKRVAAVKVLDRYQAEDSAAIEAFQHEIRAVARLSHPSIVRVFDHGRIPPEAADASAGAVHAASPYLVMELLDGGALVPSSSGMPWERLRVILLQVLGGLAHAHARHVLHRDVKPDNILRSGDGQRLVLTDFGLARALGHEHTDDPALAHGTLSYMAPEQLSGQWRDFGPWTDLYALGCTAWHLATGAPPFQGEPGQVFRAHMQQEPPRFLPVQRYPAGVEVWLRRLLAKSPGDRFEFAGEARDALEDLPALAPPAATVVASLSDTLDEDVHDELTDADVLVAMDPRASARRPVPNSWRGLSGAEWAGTDAATTAGLFALRDFGTVGRGAERDHLWATLAEAAREQHPHLVIIEGPAGSGKTRLARWLTEITHEHGLASVLEATHAPHLEAASGLGAMLRRHLRAGGLRPADARVRVRQAIRRAGITDEEIADALSVVMYPQAGADIGSSDDPLASRPHVLGIQGLLAREAERRPVLLVLEDVQWGPDALELAEHICGDDDGPGVLVLVTVDPDAIPERSEVHVRLERLRFGDRVSTLAIDALPQADLARLFHERVGLHVPAARDAAAAASGQTLLGLQLVGEWLASEALVEGPGGLVWRTGEMPATAAELGEIWRARLDRALAHLSGDALQAVEVAAVLGRTVVRAEWMTAAAHAGCEDAEAVLDALLASGLAVRDASAVDAMVWAFSHEALRAAVEAQAVAQGRSARWHAACAAMLAGRDASGIAERRARHLIEAGQETEAFAPLLVSARERIHQGDMPEAAALLSSAERLLVRHEIPSSDPRWGLLQVVRSDLAEATGDLDRATRIAETVLASSRKHRWMLPGSQAVRRLGSLARTRGDLRNARTYLVAAQRAAQQLNNALITARVLRDTADLEQDAGRLVEAVLLYRQAHRAFTMAGDRESAARCCLRMGRLARESGRLEEAAGLLERARQGFDASDQHRLAILCAYDDADQLRAEGRLEEAAEAYRDAHRRYVAVGLRPTLPDLGLAMVLTRMNQEHEARAVLERTLQQAIDRGRWRTAALAHALLLPSLVAMRDWAAYDHHLAEAEAVLDETGAVSADVAMMTELAGVWGSRTNERRRATAAWRLSIDQWNRLGRVDRVAVVQERLTGPRSEPA